MRITIVWIIVAALLVFGVLALSVDREKMLILQLEGQGLPNPLGAFLVRNYDARRVIEAARVLAERPVRSHRVVPALIDALDRYHNVDSGDGIIPVRSEIALALGRIKDPAAIRPLVAVLESRDAVRLSASASVPQGYKLAEGTSYAAVAEALGMFGPAAREALPVLRKRAQQQGGADKAGLSAIAAAIEEIES